MTVKWTNNSFEKMVAKLTFSDDDIRELLENILNRLGNRLRELIADRAPFDTGVYSQDWKVDKIQGNSITVSNPDGKLFTILEFTGRRPGKIEGDPILHFVINGRDIFVAFINHPGTQPEPHVRPALEQLGREAKEIMLDELKKKFPIFG